MTSTLGPRSPSQVVLRKAKKGGYSNSSYERAGKEVHRPGTLVHYEMKKSPRGTAKPRNISSIWEDRPAGRRKKSAEHFPTRQQESGMNGIYRISEVLVNKGKPVLYSCISESMVKST